jgi:hypothetical protein
MTENLPSEEQTLNAAVQALRQQAQAESVPEDLLARLTVLGPASGVEVHRDSVPAAPRRRRWLRPALGLAAAAVLAMLLGLTAYHLGLFRGNPAFADVVGRLGQTHSVFFTSSVSVDGKPFATVKTTLAEPGFLRMQSAAPVNQILTYDETRSEGLILLTDKKEALALTGAGLPKEMATEMAAQIAWYRSLRNAKDLSVEDLGPRRIGAEATFGFRVKKAGQDFDVWVSRKTSLPVQVEAKLPPINGQVAQLIVKDFVFDAPLPPDLFSLTPPPGYTVTNKLKIALPSEEDLVYFLRTAASWNNGIFPPDLTLKTLQDLEKHSGARKMDLAATLKLTSGLMFMHLRQKDGEWRYQGKSVKLGDAARMVCVWREKGMKRYRAVFGDLQIRSVTAADLPLK